jgi:hypothetical protein
MVLFVFAAFAFFGNFFMVLSFLVLFSALGAGE